MQKIKRILVSQPKPSSDKSPYFDIEKKYGIKLDFKPFIRIEPVAAKEFRTQKVNILDHTAILFTAKVGIDHFFRLCEEMRITVPDDMKYFCVSEQVSLYLQKYIQYRKRKMFYGATSKLEDLVAVITKHTDEKYLVVMSDVHEVNKCVEQKKDIIDYLEEINANYTKAVMYKTVSTDFTKDPDFNYDMFMFFSPSGITSLYANFPNFEQGDIKIGCFGPTTIKAAKDKGLVVNVEAPTPENPSMAAALDAFLKSQK
ncbi:MAG: uroporphyrinogen-III synthase [Paludibacteraceae bacterium]|nr:uroporphyrinogen-III synthase [Paludibacteraceae bacterium]MBR6104290.1 uroporphyrinogen-III synthase [Paludibacteraceae bacterium]